MSGKNQEGSDNSAEVKFDNGRKNPDDPEQERQIKPKDTKKTHLRLMEIY